MKYYPIIGLEVHVELATKSKMFCGCPADHFGKEPNTQTCPVCLALPGALPVPNKKAIEWTILLGLALDCQINEVSKFDRKNYFYPDLPKGYQISQYDEPFCEWGKLGDIRIRRVHLEEDTGKLLHRDKETLVDFNRSGVPLVEIVTEPDFHSIDEVDIYLKKLQKIIRYLGISSADMEKGSMRLEPSISMTTDYGLPLPAYRVELKNINSFRFVRKALEFEIERQSELLVKGEPLLQQTRGWDETKNKTFAQREKEEAHDYRYFPEPDIPPMRITNDQIEGFKKQIPELPDAKITRFVTQYTLSEYQSNILVEDKQTAMDFENKVKDMPDYSAKDIANSIINKRPLPAKATTTVDETELDEVIKKVLAQNPKAVEDYKNGKMNAFGFLMGMVLKQIKASPDIVRTILQKALSS
ncbi:hypothetical protein A2872_00680 [Candidatus Gottesmanbacteria bacterium RIFCSPHIGHO2_01_FULL_42_12]|uniref:Aspartyl/glutamyl-tRNA(Asn/Gln) amidotransferase subunit B n=1 Tax=Candidatus Gottesmanbacteria bacterium RIFCSPHIGHO2_01_FULL_42_12 TaxID=1798377 RepID=A0A1F5YZK7_9BACT|nr:MAG: hypothetical protein A2872_00680 [Candidatus Gottesmanbacteria bacterium RIFCSPHIGHO2_01_FULL_42_12]